MTPAQNQKQIDDAAELEKKIAQLQEQCFHVFCDEYQDSNEAARELASELVVEDDQYRTELEFMLQGMYQGNSQQHRVYEGIIERAVRRLLAGFDTLDKFERFVDALR